MTAAERILLNRLRRRARHMSPDLVRREMAAYEMIREVLSEAELVRAIESGQLDRLIFEILDDGTLDPAFARLRLAVDRSVLDSARLEATKHLPSFLQPIAFNILSPHVVQAVRILDTRVIDGLKDEVRETVRQRATAGIRAGEGPRTTARGMRAVIGMAPNQEEAVSNFRRMLTEGDREALTRALRDRRFDSTLRRTLGRGGAGLTRDQIERMVAAYRRRMIAFNAETHARTVALDAQKLGQRLAWVDAIERGIVSRDQLTREWVAVGGPKGDGRNRPEHLAMHGESVGFDEPFSNGELVPGDSTYNCRCVSRVKIARAAARNAA